MVNSKRNIFLHSCLAAGIACLFSIAWSFYNNSDGDGINVNAHPNHSKDVLHAISGALGSALSITLLYPLETVRTRLQVSDACKTPASSFGHIFNIAKSEGVRHGLYKGWSSLVMTLMILNFVYFYCFRGLRRWIMVLGDDNYDNDVKMFLEGNKVLVDLVAGYLAGVVAVLITGPLWLVNTRLKLQGVNIGQSSDNSKTKTNPQYTGIFHCLYRITKEEGILTLWHGTFTSIILALNPAIQLGVYEMLKRHHYFIVSIASSSNEEGSGGSFEPFVNALIAKFIATIITYPIQVLQTRHRAGLKNDTKKEKDIAQSPRETDEKKSMASIFLGLYRGLESKLLQTCLNSAVMFVAYERLVGILTSLLNLEE